MKKYYVTQSCSKFTPILKVFYKNIKSLNFFDGIIVYTDDKNFNPNDNFVNVIHGKDRSYSSNLKNAVDACDQDCFFCGCEDYMFLKEDFNRNSYLINSIFNFFSSYKNLGILRLNKAVCISDKSKFIDKPLGIYEVPKKYQYCVNLQPCIWKKEFFYDLFKDKLDAWEFELKFSSRAREHDMVCACTEKDLMVLINGNKQGNSYRDKFVDLADSFGSEIDFSNSLVYVKKNGIKKTVSYKEYIKNNKFEK